MQVTEEMHVCVFVTDRCYCFYLCEMYFRRCTFGGVIEKMQVRVKGVVYWDLSQSILTLNDW